MAYTVKDLERWQETLATLKSGRVKDRRSEMYCYIKIVAIKKELRLS